MRSFNRNPDASRKHRKALVIPNAPGFEDHLGFFSIETCFWIDLRFMLKDIHGARTRENRRRFVEPIEVRPRLIAEFLNARFAST